MLKLHVIIASTRRERRGPAIARWFLEQASHHGRFDVELVDLKTVDLPLLDESKDPRLRQYENPSTQAWSRSVDAADAFVFVTPEYNHGPPPALVNALDHVYTEWHYKPAGFVSYGGVSGGTRSAELAKQILTTLRVMPVPDAVAIPFVSQLIDEAGGFRGDARLERSVTTMLDELLRWAQALRSLRA